VALPATPGAGRGRNRCRSGLARTARDVVLRE
jgi:hypothetical protein